MSKLNKGKIATGLVVLSTIILAGVAIFTAFRLYQLRKESISPAAPESQPLAWDCSKYTFSVGSSGVVSVNNQSTRDESSQQATVYINENEAATLAVPALPRGQSADIGTVQVPSGGFSWRVVGSRDCSSSGTTAAACQALTFTLSAETPTPSPEVTVTATPSPEPTATLAPSVTATDTPTNPPGATNTPTPIKPPSIPEPPQCTATRPDAPILLSVERSGSNAILKWTKVDLATHYVISYGTSPDNFQYGVPNTGNVTTFTVGQLSAGTKYYFTVYAVNDCMPSAGSKVITSVAGVSTSTGEQLPATGISIPTVAGIGAGILIIAAALILAI